MALIINLVGCIPMGTSPTVPSSGIKHKMSTISTKDPLMKSDNFMARAG